MQGARRVEHLRVGNLRVHPQQLWRLRQRRRQRRCTRHTPAGMVMRSDQPGAPERLACGPLGSQGGSGELLGRPLLFCSDGAAVPLAHDLSAMPRQLAGAGWA